MCRMFTLGASRAVDSESLRNYAWMNYTHMFPLYVIFNMIFYMSSHMSFIHALTMS